MENIIKPILKLPTGARVWSIPNEFSGASVQARMVSPGRGGVTRRRVPKALLAHALPGDYLANEDGMCYPIIKVVLGQDQHFTLDGHAGRLIEELAPHDP